MFLVLYDDSMQEREEPDSKESPKEVKREAFKQSILENLNGLYGFALSLTRNHHQANDLVQEACLRAWRGFHQFKEGTNFKAWLFTILRNTFINEYRREKRSPEKVSMDDEDNFSFYAKAQAQLKTEGKHSVPDALDPSKLEEVLGDEVHKALHDLPEEYREAILLSDVQDLSYADIAGVLDVPIGTVRSRLARGRAMLQKRLWDYAHSKGLFGGSAK